MAAMSTKSTFALQFTGSEAENAMRKMVFAAAVGIQDGTLSNLAQPLVRIALKLFMLLRAHRAAHAGPGAYVPPDDAAHDHWMTNEQDLLDAVAELEAELTTHYVKDKIDGAAAANVQKRANKRRMLLQKVNSIVRDGLLQAIRGKTLLSHLENKEYVTEEIENLNTITPAQAMRLVSLTCVRLIIDIFSVMAKRGGSGKSLFQDLCALPDPSKDSWSAVERRLYEAKSHLLSLRPADAEAVIDLMIAMQLLTLLQQGTLLPDEKYREAYRLVLDGVEQQLDAPGQLGPLSLAKMKEFGAQLQVTLQNRGLSEVPPKIVAANKQFPGEARALLGCASSRPVGGESLQINPLQTSCHQLPLGFLAAVVVGKTGEGAKVDARRDKSPLHLPENVSCAGRWDASRQRAQMATRMRKRSTQQSKLNVRVRTRTGRCVCCLLLHLLIRSFPIPNCPPRCSLNFLFHVFSLHFSMTCKSNSFLCVAQ